MKNCLAAIAFVAAIAGCNGRIPNDVGSDEYEVYAEWTKAYFSKNLPGNLYVSSHTFVFDPLKTDDPCYAGHNKSAIPRTLLKQLHALGQSEYRLELDSPDSKLQIPWSCTVVDDWQLIPPESSPFQVQEFSRIAFDRAHNDAFFAVHDVCGGLCGHGGTVHAHKRNGAWVFQDGGCVWMSEALLPRHSEISLIDAARQRVHVINTDQLAQSGALMEQGHYLTPSSSTPAAHLDVGFCFLAVERCMMRFANAFREIQSNTC